MTGGRRNPLTVTLSRLVESVRESSSSSRSPDVAVVETANLSHSFVDLEIQFIGANNLPKLDVVGCCDPYFVAKIDSKVSFVSTVKERTVTPVWNEIWRVNTVPTCAELIVEVFDKDEGKPHDDYVGKFKTMVSAGTKESEILHPLLPQGRGKFYLKITSSPCNTTEDVPSHLKYLFDGPIRFSRHFSSSVGRLTNLNDARLYSTWKIYLRGVPLFLESTQPWNTSYKAAQSIFGPGPTAMALRSGIQAGHRLLYARTARDGTGVINDSPQDVMKILTGCVKYEGWMSSYLLRRRTQRSWSSSSSLSSNSKRQDSNGELQSSPTAESDSSVSKKDFEHRVKPTVYTYIISSDDNSFRFSETGAAFFVDFASKHALHSNCAPTVRYSGEFHPRPRGGWENFSDETKDEEVPWEMVIDNNSGTYAPDKALLPDLKNLLEHNFPGFAIFAYDREDQELIRSRDACRDFGTTWRGLKREETVTSIVAPSSSNTSTS